MLRFLKDWALPLAMATGALTNEWVSRLAFLTPYLIFVMLIVTFCKISLKEIRFHRAHVWLLVIQLACSIGLYYALLPFDSVVAQGALLCVLAPTATAAAVITGMLGGNVGFLTAYVLFCNVAVAVAAPVYFSLTGAGSGMGFLESVWYICQKVFPLLILPLFIALPMRKVAPRLQRLIVSIPKLAFYLWVIALLIVTGNTVNFMFHHQSAEFSTEWGLIGVSLVLCCMQFLVGRKIGRYYGDPISSGQGLGQKNTILAIWMAQTYLHPLTGLAPAGYIIWQNIINSYQLWRKNRKKRME
ncbi:MAG: transporter [Tannerella sp.]|jgi:BASS family bile acid:Na+ symporter|nr:transporter [Tannerella sp.]